MANVIAEQQSGLDYPLMAGAGRIAGQSSVTAFGYSSNTGAVSNVNLWQPQVVWAPAITPVGIEYSSTSASDGVAGTGARKILVIGVGPAFVQQIETVTMNGTTVVASIYTWIAINTMVVFDNATTGFGSALGNVGDISAKVTGAGALHGFITAGFGVSQHGRYTVPAGFTWLINNFFFLGNKSGGPVATYGLNAITVTSTGLKIYGLPLTMQNGATLPIALPNTPVPLAEKNTLMFQISAVSTTGMDISGGCTGILTAN